MTKKELDAWHADENNFFNMPIVPDENELSDIILCGRKNKPDIFINCKTGKEGKSIKEVQSKKPCLFFNLQDKPSSYGMYGKFDKELDLFYIALYQLEVSENENSASWVEVPGFRSAVSKDYAGKGWLINAKEKDVDAYMFDICGEQFSKNTASMIGLKKEFMSFCNGVFFSKSSSEAVYPITLCTVKDILFVFRQLKNGGDMQDRGWLGGMIYFDEYVGISFFGDKYVTDVKPKRPVCKEALSNLKRAALAIYEKRKYGTLKDYSSDGQINYLSVLENVEGTFLVRTFLPVFYCNSSAKEPEFDLIEIKNAKLNKKSCERRNCDLGLMLQSFPVWMDRNVEDTIFEYSAHIITEMIDAFFAKLNESETLTSCDFDMAMNAAAYTIYDKYGIETQKAIKLAVEIGCDNYFEALINFRSGSEEKYTKAYKLYLIYNAVLENSTSVMGKEFGANNKTKAKLYEQMMLPKGLLEYAFDKDCLKTLWYMKTVFSSSKENMEYFCRLNKQDYEYIYDFMNDFVVIDEYYDEQNLMIAIHDMAFTLKTMVEIYGIESWRSYMEFLRPFTSIEEHESLDMYHEYLKMVKELPHDVRKNAQWKLRGKAFEKSYISTALAHDIYSDPDYENIVKFFEDKQSEWAKYLFSDENYTIVLPKSPDDIVKEGILLKHCCRSFVPYILREAGVVLFIRKNKATDEPFYTLDISNGQVRQCHGKCNSNVETKNLKAFMEKFCRSKNMKVSYGTEQHGA